jgi:flavin-dependent dehydrogenase
VIVLGAGPSGSAAATRLVREGLNVLILEEQKARTFKVGETLPGIAGKVIAAAGFPNVLRNVAQLKCSGNRSCWGSSEMRLRPGLLDPYGGGVHVDRAQLDGELLRESIGAGTQVLTGARFLRTDGWQSHWKILLRHEGQVRTAQCDCVIDCTGRRACFASTQSVRRVVVDKQVAVVSALSGNAVDDDDLTTTIESAPEGWWYSARVPDGHRIAVFFTDGDLLRDLNARSAEGFSSLMRRSIHIRSFLSVGYSVECPPAVVVADTSYLPAAAGRQWCAAGDAAAALDPLGSAGIIDALKSGSAAARLVLGGFKDVADYSSAVIGQAKANIKTRKSYYLMEKRWPAEPFWAQRHESTDGKRPA